MSINELRCGIAHIVAVPNHIPSVILPIDSHLRPVGKRRNHGGGLAGAAAEIEISAPCVNRGIPRVNRPDKGDVEEVGKTEDQIPGNFGGVALNPPRVGHIVVIADLQQHSGGIGVPDFPQSRGSSGDHQIRLRVNSPQIVDKNLGGPLSLSTVP